MTLSLGQQMARTAGIFQGITALPTMLIMGNCALEELFYPRVRVYYFMYALLLPLVGRWRQLTVSQNSSLYWTHGSGHTIHPIRPTTPEEHQNFDVLLRDREIGTCDSIVVVVDSR
jgi:hypothetical protein